MKYFELTIWELYCECGKRGLVEAPFNDYINKRDELTELLVSNDELKKS
jgi:hypothetical protein